MSIWTTLCCSREVREIVANLSPDEVKEYRDLSQREGRQFGATIVGPGAVATVIVAGALTRTFPEISSFLAWAACVGVFFAIAHCLARPMHERTRAFLGSTAYARRAGYRADALKLFRFGIS